MLTRELIPGSIYRIKSDKTSWRYAMVLSQSKNKKEIIVLSPNRSIVKIPIVDIPWIIKEMEIKFEIIQCV